MTVADVLANCLTAAEVIEQLQNVEPDAKVLFICDYGDICHTKQAIPVTKITEDMSSALRETAYSDSGIEYNDGTGDDDEDDDEEVTEYRDEDYQTIAVLE